MNPLEPFFSIIIPTLNEELYIPNLLEDIKKQKLKDFEVIVADGNSEDNTKHKAEEYKNFYNVNVVDVEKRNVQYQRNAGAANSKGKYCIFLDADTRIGNTFLSSLKKEIEKSKHLIYLPSVIPQSTIYTDKVLFQIVNLFIEISQSVGKPLPSGSAVIFERHYFNFIGGYTKKNRSNKFFPEDLEILLRAQKCGVKAKFLKNISTKFSFRRVNQEGRLNVYKKYMIGTIQMITSGTVGDKMYYEMGGHVYKKDGQSKKNTQQEMIIKIRELFNNLLQDK